MKNFKTFNILTFCTIWCASFLTPSVTFGQTYLSRQAVLGTNPAGTAQSVIFQSAAPNPNVGINVGAAPTNTLDVGGTARIRILNAATPKSHYVRADANGVLSAQPALGVNAYIATDLNGNFIAATAPWSSIGNNGTNPATNFLGTIDNQRLVFRTFNTEKMTVLGNGNLGLGIAAPTHQLHTTGTVRFQGFTLANATNRVVQTDNTGGISPIPQGAANTVLTQTATGLTWSPVIAPTGDNLGHHKATQKLNMNCNMIDSVNSIKFCPTSGLLNTYLGTDGAGNLVPKRPPTSSGWDLTGNSISPTDYIGTNNPEDLRFYTDSRQKMVLTVDNKLGLNTPTPTARFDVLSGQSKLIIEGIQFEKLAYGGCGDLLIIDNQGYVKRAPNTWKCYGPKSAGDDTSEHDPGTSPENGGNGGHGIMGGNTQESKQSTEVKQLKAENEALKERLDRIEKMLSLNTSASKTNSKVPPSVSSIKLVSSPNPAQSTATISYEIPESFKTKRLIVSDLTGKEIKHFDLKDCCGNVSIDVKDLANGVFMVSLVSENEVLTSTKLVVSK